MKWAGSGKRAWIREEFGEENGSERDQKTLHGFIKG